MIIGLDPGAHTGVAFYRLGKLIDLDTIEPYRIPELIRIHQPERVVFEDSRLQSYVWTSASNRAVAVKMARNIGEIDAWCTLITGICEIHKIDAHGVSPKSKGAKLDAEAFNKMTGWTERSNQHERDAAMVAWRYRFAKKD